ncbi:hypothetical protein J6590_063791 [Homalodisca vitripennis]|nr:hypothetical protein J6590_063791 [Homalodisca vitripennis]
MGGRQSRAGQARPCKRARCVGGTRTTHCWRWRLVINRTGAVAHHLGLQHSHQSSIYACDNTLLAVTVTVHSHTRFNCSIPISWRLVINRTGAVAHHLGLQHSHQSSIYACDNTLLAVTVTVHSHTRFNCSIPISWRLVINRTGAVAHHLGLQHSHQSSIYTCDNTLLAVTVTVHSHTRFNCSIPISWRLVINRTGVVAHHLGLQHSHQSSVYACDNTLLAVTVTVHSHTRFNCSITISWRLVINRTGVVAHHLGLQHSHQSSVYACDNTLLAVTVTVHSHTRFNCSIPISWRLVINRTGAVTLI